MHDDGVKNSSFELLSLAKKKKLDQDLFENEVFWSLFQKKKQINIVEIGLGLGPDLDFPRFFSRLIFSRFFS